MIGLILHSWHRFSRACSRIQAFQKRIWIVSIQNKEAEQGSLFNDTYVVSEDDFSSPMSWMHKKGYSVAVIKKIDTMQRSQVVKVTINEQYHSLVRVK